MMASPERKTPCQRTAHRVGVTISLAPSAASAETLQRAIDEALANKPDSGGDAVVTE